MSWIEEQYPIGRKVEAAGDDQGLHPGVITAHTQEGGIIISFDGDGYVEVEASFLDESGNGPFVHDLRKPGRPVLRAGDYARITLEIRRDLLAKIDASGKSRREYIETLLE